MFKFLNRSSERRSANIRQALVKAGLSTATDPARVMVVESKGKHLQRNPDTEYKRSIADYFTKLGHEVPWQKLAADFRDSTFRVQVLDEGEYGEEWRDKLKKLLNDAR